MSVQTTVTNLRNVADFLVKHQTIIEGLSYEAADDAGVSWEKASYVQMYAGCYGDVEFSVHGPDAVNLAATLRRHFGGKWDKSHSDYYLTLSRTVENVEVQIRVSRDEACRKVITGTRLKTVPAVEAQPARTEIEDVIDWVCDPILDNS